MCASRKSDVAHGSLSGVGGLYSNGNEHRPVIKRRYIKLCMPDMGTRASFSFFLPFFFPSFRGLTVTGLRHTREE